MPIIMKRKSEEEMMICYGGGSLWIFLVDSKWDCRDIGPFW